MEDAAYSPATINEAGNQEPSNSRYKFYGKFAMIQQV